MWILKLHITKFKIIKVTIKNNYIKKLKIKYTKINHNIIFFVLSMIIIQYTSYSAKKDSLLTVYPKKGDGIGIILKRYNIPATKEYIETFKTMNTNRLDKNSNIVLDKLYVLPIKVLPFNGKNIRTSINNSDRSIAEKVQEYNLKMKSKGLKDDFKKDKTLWLPIDNILSETFLNEEELKNSIAEKKIDNSPENNNKFNDNDPFYLLNNIKQMLGFDNQTEKSLQAIPQGVSWTLEVFAKACVDNRRQNGGVCI